MRIFRTRVTFTGGITGPGVSTWHWSAPDATTDAAALSALESATGGFWTPVKNVVSSGVTIALDAEVDELNPATGQVIDTLGAAPWTMAGLDGGDPLPYQTNGLVKWKTGVWFDGKEVSGRTFIPAPCEGNSTAGKPIASYITELQNAASTMLGAATVDLVVWSKKASAPYLVSSRSVYSKWASLRSRRD